MPEDRPPQSGYADSPGWYGDREWRGKQARYGGLADPEPPDPRPHADPERYGEDQRYEAERYEAARRDPVRPESGVGELPRVDPGRPVDPGTSRLPPVGPRSGPQPPDVEPVPPRRLASTPGSPGLPGPVGDNVYRSKRTGTAALFGVAAAVLEIPALLLLGTAVFGDPVSASGVVAAASLMCALPLAAVGLYAVATGAVRAAGPNSVQAWLRPPVAYLSVALVLFVAAGLAA